MEGITPQKRWPWSAREVLQGREQLSRGHQPCRSRGRCRGRGVPAREKGSGWGASRTYHSVIGETMLSGGCEVVLRGKKAESRLYSCRKCLSFGNSCSHSKDTD